MNFLIDLFNPRGEALLTLPRQLKGIYSYYIRTTSDSLPTQLIVPGTYLPEAVSLTHLMNQANGLKWVFGHFRIHISTNALNALSVNELQHLLAPLLNRTHDFQFEILNNKLIGIVLHLSDHSRLRPRIFWVDQRLHLVPDKTLHLLVDALSISGLQLFFTTPYLNKCLTEDLRFQNSLNQHILETRFEVNVFGVFSGLKILIRHKKLDSVSRHWEDQPLNRVPIDILTKIIESNTTSQHYYIGNSELFTDFSKLSQVLRSFKAQVTGLSFARSSIPQPNLIGGFTKCIASSLPNQLRRLDLSEMNGSVGTPLLPAESFKALLQGLSNSLVIVRLRGNRFGEYALPELLMILSHINPRIAQIDLAENAMGLTASHIVQFNMTFNRRSGPVHVDPLFFYQLYIYHLLRKKDYAQLLAGNLRLKLPGELTLKALDSYSQRAILPFERLDVGLFLANKFKAKFNTSTWRESAEYRAHAAVSFYLLVFEEPKLRTLAHLLLWQMKSLSNAPESFRVRLGRLAVPSPAEVTSKPPKLLTNNPLPFFTPIPNEGRKFAKKEEVSTPRL